MKIRILGFFLLALCQLNGQAQGVQNALSFDGTNDYVDCGNNSSVQISGNQITLEAWIYPTAWKPLIWQGNIIAKEQNGFGNDNGYMLRAGNNGSLNLTLGSGSWSELISNTNELTLNTWQHVAGTYDGSYLRLYVNGNVIDSLAATISISNSTSLLYLGDNGSGARNFPGIIEEVRIWNVARSKAEILAKMNEDLCGNDLGLVANYRMNQGIAGATNTISRLTDETGLNNGTLQNFSLSGVSSNFVAGRSLVGSTFQDTIADTICNGQIYQFGSQSLGSAGFYNEVFQALNGCDSTVYLDLAVAAPINILVNANRKDSMYAINQSPTATYQWYDCATGQHFSGATQSYFQPSYTGTFAVIITEGNCSDTSFCIAGNSGSGVGLKELSFTSVDVYPQPAQHTLHIELLSAVSSVDLYFYDSNGQLVLKEEFSDCQSMQVDCSQFSAGFYSLKIEFENQILTEKILIQ